MAWPVSPGRTALEDLTAQLQASTLLAQAQQPQPAAQTGIGGSPGTGRQNAPLPGPTPAGPAPGALPRGGRARMGGRDRGRGGDGRQARDNRRLWEQVRNAPRGQPPERAGQLAPQDMTVEEIGQLIQNLPPHASVVEAVQDCLHVLDSRALAFLLKQLAQVGCGQKAVELFNHLRQLPVTDPPNPLSKLCDVYTYTTIISVYGQLQELPNALLVIDELKRRNIPFNIHTLSSLINVCIKCGDLELALKIFESIPEEGLTPNVVTYNTLIDVYGKSGRWEKAVQVLDDMRQQGLEPQVRTYNTAIIACNMCGQPHAALEVYQRLLAAGITPISTTYTALISAHSKAGDVNAALQTFDAMVRAGCERSVITYSSLIAACEKAGMWQRALDLFERRMPQDGIQPNTITYNSLITACSQGGQWEKAAQVFADMRRNNCKPDAVTYTALISAYERSQQWQNALRAFETMRGQQCRPDCNVYQMMVDLLWSTGITWVQARAWDIYSNISSDCLARLTVQPQARADRDVLECLVPMQNLAVATMAIIRWLQDLRRDLAASTSSPPWEAVLKSKVVLVLGRSRHQRDQSGPSIRDSIISMLMAFCLPFQSAPHPLEPGVPQNSLECPSGLLYEWLMAQEPDGRGGPYEHFVGAIFAELRTQPSAFLGPLPAGTPGRRRPPPGGEASLLFADMQVEQRCLEEYGLVLSFETSHGTSLEPIEPAYAAMRQSLVTIATDLRALFALPWETVYDAVQLMDRVRPNEQGLSRNLWRLFVATAMLMAGEQTETSWLPTTAQLEEAMGYARGSVRTMETNIRGALNGDTAVTSSLSVLKLYLQRLGHPPSEDPRSFSGGAISLLHATLGNYIFLHFPPSMVAAAVLHRERRARGLLPAWPTALTALLGLHDADRSSVFFQLFQAAAQALDMMLGPPVGQGGLAGLQQAVGVPWMTGAPAGQPQGLQGVPVGLQHMLPPVLPPGYPPM